MRLLVILFTSFLTISFSQSAWAACGDETYSKKMCRGECYCDCGNGPQFETSCSFWGQCPTGNGAACSRVTVGPQDDPCTSALSIVATKAESGKCGIWDNRHCTADIKPATGSADGNGCCTKEIKVECKPKKSKSATLTEQSNGPVDDSDVIDDQLIEEIVEQFKLAE